MAQVQKWLSDRQTVIVALHNLCSFRPFMNEQSLEILNESLQEFCTLMVDYISLGHFEIYEYISDRIKIPKRVLECLMDTTVFALDFNDKYIQKNELTTLEKDLSRLALVFAQRLEWEDHLLAQFEQARQNTLAIAKTA